MEKLTIITKHRKESEMKQLMKKVIFIVLCMMTISSLNAETIVTVDGINYSLSGAYASVRGLAQEMTDVSVHEKIEYQGLTYIVNRIGTNAFAYYDEFRNPMIDNHPQPTIAAYKPKENSLIKSVTLPSTIATIDSYAFSNPNISEVTIGENVTAIGMFAFAFSGISTIKLSEGIKNIKAFTFYYSRITKLIIPKSVETFEKITVSNHYGNNYDKSGTFEGCDLLRTLIYLGEKCPTNWWTASFTYVPSKKTYSSSNNNVIEMITFSDSTFIYEGIKPSTTWVNNMSDYTETLNMPILKSDVGSYEEIVPVTFTKGEESFIANIPYKYTIEPVKLKVKVNNANRTYGELNPEFTFSYSGFIIGDNEDVLTSRPKAITTANEKSAVGTYPITISGGEAKNYTFEYEQGELTVNKASLGIQVMDASKVYGSNNPTFTLGYSGLKNEETVPEWTTAPKFTTTATKESGTGTYEVSVTCDPKNYEIVTNTSGKLTIKKAPLNIKANNTTMDYCGTMPSYSFTYSGFVNDDTEDALSTKPSIATEATTTSNSGTYTITPEGAQANNYDFTYTAGTLTIKQRPLTVKANSASRLYGEENPTFTVEYSGFVNNETKAVLDVEPTVSTTATIQSKAGTYDIRVSGGRAVNYALTYQNGQLTISPRPLKAFVGNYERPYGEDNPAFTIEYEGLVGNDTGYSLTQQPMARTSATKISNVGTYPIEVTGGYSPNYTLSYGSGILTIVKSEQTFTWNQDLTNLKVGDQVELQASVSSNLPITFTADSENFAEIYKAGSKTYMECKKAGSFHIKAVQDGNDNYYSTQRINKEVTIVGEDEYNPTLFIKQTDNGMVSTKVNKGSTHTFTIYVETGWKIHSVTFNDTDVTNKLSSGNTYTTPEITENSTLTVVYEQENSAVNTIQNSNVKILATSDGIRVTGVNSDDVIRVYTIDGTLKKSVRAEGPQIEITLHKNNIYVVKVGIKTVKLRL